MATTVLVSGIVVSVFLWLALNHREERYFHSVSNQHAQAITRELVARMDARVHSLERLARWSARISAESRADWEDSAEMLYAQDGGYQAIYRIAPGGVVEWAVPVESAQWAVGFDMTSMPKRAAAMTASRERRKIAASMQTTLHDGTSGFLILVPIYVDDAFHGWIAGVFETQKLLSTILRRIPLEGYELSIANAEGIFYAVGTEEPRMRRPVGVAQLQHYGLTWDVRAWPSKETYQSEKSAWPHGVLLIGVIMSALLSTSIQLAQTSRQRTHEAEHLNRELNTEIEQRRSAEQELQQTAERLEISNRELQDFASVASHDLQEPLRKIQAFGDRLRVKCADTLSENGVDYLNRMQSAARRMQTLINDLLTFSRVTTKAQPFVETDLNDIARDVVSDLMVRLEQTGGKVELAPLPTVEADPLQMRQLLQNLISNGLKFRRPDVPPVVQVGGRMVPALPKDGPALPKDGRDESGESDTDFEIYVKDNGIGFDEKYLDRIFTVFQRLHGRTEYEGTGIGLAVCRKIAERHGGSITASSTPGSGSRFVVRLPKKHHAQDGVEP